MITKKNAKKKSENPQHTPWEWRRNGELSEHSTNFAASAFGEGEKKIKKLWWCLSAEIEWDTQLTSGFEAGNVKGEGTEGQAKICKIKERQKKK